MPAGASRDVRHALEASVVGAAAAAVSRLPEAPARAFGGAAGTLAGRVLRVRRGLVDAHLELAFPEADPAWRQRVARASYAHLGREAAFLLGWRRADPARLRDELSIEGGDALQAALAGGRGAVVVTGHLGNWEVGGLALTTFGVPVVAGAKPMANPRVDRRLEARRRGLGFTPVPPAALIGEALAILGRGGIAAFVADQDAGPEGVFVPFFGRPASTPRGPALLALRSGAPLFLGVALRDRSAPGGYRARVEPVEVPRTGRRDRDVPALTGAYTEALERAVRLHAEQYFWQHRRWKSAPRDSPPQEPAPRRPV